MIESFPKILHRTEKGITPRFVEAIESRSSPDVSMLKKVVIDPAFSIRFEERQKLIWIQNPVL
jgi:hypothetical protein